MLRPRLEASRAAASRAARALPLALPVLARRPAPLLRPVPAAAPLTAPARPVAGPARVPTGVAGLPAGVAVARPLPVLPGVTAAGSEPVPAGLAAAGSEPAPAGLAVARSVTEPAGVVCRGLTVRYRGRADPTVRNVGFVVPPRGLLAVVGPSGSGKSTLCAAILGEVEQTTGQVLLGGVDLLQARSLGRRLISFVPQRDALHHELTPHRALTLTAALRLAPQVPADERARRVDHVLDLLDLGEHAGVRIGSLSGGQRKRVAVAMELLSEPQLLMLDEPTSGLDEGLDRVMMTLLRRVADDGCAVLVVTHSTANLTLADAVLALDSTGRVAYCGAPDAMLEVFRASDHAEAMQTLRAGPGERVLRAGDRHGGNRRPGRITALAGGGAVRAPDRLELGTWHCTRVLAAREFHRMAAGPLTVARGFLLLPLLTCLLTSWVDDQGLAGWPGQPNRLQGATLSVLITCTSFFAMALSFSTIVGEREVIEREHRWGVPPTAVLLSKLLALLGPVVLQSVLTVIVYLAVRPGPDHVLGGWPVGPVLALLLAVLGVTSMCLGLLISAAARGLERAVFLLMGTTAVLVVLTGLLIPFGEPGGMGSGALSALGQFAPTRWGTAALAAYIGYVPIEVVDRGGRSTADPAWTQDAAHLVGAVSSLLVLALLYGLVAATVLVRQSRRRR